MRRRFVYNPQTDSMEEISLERRSAPASAYIQPDIQPFQSSIDGTVISTRSQLREHMYKHDVVNPADYTEHRKRKAAEREARINGSHPEVRAERIRTISDAYESTRNRRLSAGTWNR